MANTQAPSTFQNVHLCPLNMKLLPPRHGFYFCFKHRDTGSSKWSHTASNSINYQHKHQEKSPAAGLHLCGRYRAPWHLKTEVPCKENLRRTSSQENTLNRNKKGAPAWVQNVSNFINCANKNICEFLQNSYLQSNKTQQDSRCCWKASSIPAPFCNYTTHRNHQKSWQKQKRWVFLNE